MLQNRSILTFPAQQPFAWFLRPNLRFAAVKFPKVNLPKTTEAQLTPRLYGVTITESIEGGTI
jgi:hypothetical protein